MDPCETGAGLREPGNLPMPPLGAAAQGTGTGGHPRLPCHAQNSPRKTASPSPPKSRAITNNHESHHPSARTSVLPHGRPGPGIPTPGHHPRSRGLCARTPGSCSRRSRCQRARTLGNCCSALKFPTRRTPQAQGRRLRPNPGPDPCLETHDVGHQLRRLLPPPRNPRTTSPWDTWSPM